jgi:hypothetical protein
MTLTTQEATDLCRRFKEARDGKGRLLDLIMPNGKRFGECTREDCEEIIKELSWLELQREANSFAALHFINSGGTLEEWIEDGKIAAARVARE